MLSQRGPKVLCPFCLRLRVRWLRPLERLYLCFGLCQLHRYGHYGSWIFFCISLVHGVPSRRLYNVVGLLRFHSDQSNSYFCPTNNRENVPLRTVQSCRPSINGDVRRCSVRLSLNPYLRNLGYWCHGLPIYVGAWPLCLHSYALC